MTPTARTLAYLRDELGMLAATVERWNPHAHIRQDLFGWADVLAASEDRGIVAVQCTSGTNHAARVAKIRSIETAERWLAAGGRIWVVSWSKRGARGARKLWTPRVVELTKTGEVELEEAA